MTSTGGNLNPRWNSDVLLSESTYTGAGWIMGRGGGVSISGLPGIGSATGGSSGRDDDDATASAWDALMLARNILMTSRRVPLGKKLTVPESALALGEMAAM